ncbi:hypothetical protein M8C21_030979 [Ambrosia artemisiifolia]|uniref:Uncharacterized protein n=1 Tax=Ambrosia artemisiifolia TaxID=4212 RepID=A0AAD5D1P0_AMBAR|nr:hypothetical protein M8C21_030979 [Ambrosia artemisiifolia]
MAGALDGELVHYLPTITSHLREAIAPRRGRPSLEALACVGNIAKAMGPAMETHVRSLLDAMFSAGLSSVLVESLEQITISIPSLLPTIQDRLLESISTVLSKPQNAQTRTSGTPSRVNTTNNMQQMSELSGSALEQLALQTLARFNFMGHDLLEFARESVVVYLEDDDGATRKDAALCCCKLVVNSFSIVQFSLSRSSRAGGKRRRLIEEIVEKLLIAAVADADVSVRNSIFSSLHGNEGFDDFLAQADSLTAIFAALNDEDLQVREYAISVAGRLSEKNPAYVFPALRRHLIQLLTYLGQSADSKCREESAKLLGCLIRSCERLILPYIAPIHKALLAKLCEGTAGVNANSGIISGVLVTVGDLARVFYTSAKHSHSHIDEEEYRVWDILHLVEQLCLALNDEFRRYLPVILPGCIQVLSDAERKNDELRKDAVDALCCLAHALGEDFTIFIPSIHKLLLKHRLRHKEFEEIEGRLQRRGPLILGSVAAQKSIRQPPVEVISDPLSDMENDPYEDVHKQLKVHQVFL